MKLNSDSKQCLAGLLVAGSVLGGITYVNHKRDQDIRQDYANLPAIRIITNFGDGIDRLTKKYVDTDKYTVFIRRPQFTNDNKLDAEKISQKGLDSGYYLVRYDPIYLQKKNQSKSRRVE